MYESPWLSIQWRCFQTCFNIPSTLDWYTPARAQKGALDINLHTDLVANPGKGEAGINTRVEKEVYETTTNNWKGEWDFNPSCVLSCSYIWAFISTNNGVCILTLSLDFCCKWERFVSQSLKVSWENDGQKCHWWPPRMESPRSPTAKRCCWKTWFPGTRCYTNLGYHCFWWRKEMDLGISGWTIAGKTHTLTVNLIFLKLTLRVDAGLRKRLPACQNGNDAWWFCSKPTNCTPQENNPTDRHWTTPNKSTSHLPKMFSAIVLYEHLRACFHF